MNGLMFGDVRKRVTSMSARGEKNEPWPFLLFAKISRAKF
jgi:hypothetical protein